MYPDLFKRPRLTPLNVSVHADEGTDAEIPSLYPKRGCLHFRMIRRRRLIGRGRTISSDTGICTSPLNSYMSVTFVFKIIESNFHQLCDVFRELAFYMVHFSF